MVPINETGGVNDTSYNLQTKSVYTNNTWVNVTNITSSNNFTFTNITAHTVFSYRIRASNIYGFGPFSEEFEIARDLPKLIPPTISENETLIIFNWTQGNKSFDEYRVEFRLANDSYETNTLLCNASNETNCSI